MGIGLPVPSSLSWKSALKICLSFTKPALIAGWSILSQPIFANQSFPVTRDSCSMTDPCFPNLSASALVAEPSPKLPYYLRRLSLTCASLRPKTSSNADWLFYPVRSSNINLAVASPCRVFRKSPVRGAQRCYGNNCFDAYAMRFFSTSESRFPISS